MNRQLKHGLITIVTVISVSVLIVTSSMAETPKKDTEQSNGQAMYPNGMMGPGYGGYRGMGPGNMPYGGMGPGYMHRDGRGYGGMGYGMGMMGYGGGMGMMQALNLDKKQRSEIRALMRKQRELNCKAMTQMMDVRDELAAEYDKNQPNATTIGKLYEKMQVMQRHMLERMVETHNKVRALLNKEQRENFDHMFPGGMGMMNMMGGMMGYGGQGMMQMMGNGGMGYGGMMGYGGWNREE